MKVVTPLATRLFNQKLMQADNKENIKILFHWSFWWVSPVTGEFPLRRANNAANATISWRHRVVLCPISCSEILFQSEGCIYGVLKPSVHISAPPQKFWTFQHLRPIFTRGQFSGIVTACVCVCVCVCVSVCVCVCVCVSVTCLSVTRDPFKIWTKGAKPLGQGPYSFVERSTLTFKIKFTLEIKIYPILSLSA